jgi:urease accessory protein
VQADGVVVAELRDGRTVVTRLRSEPPITLRRTGQGIVHQVASGAGPIGGDILRLQVRVGAGASLVLRTVAAAVVLPGPTGEPSRTVLEAEVEAGGTLVVVPQPQVLADGADHEVTTRVRLAAGASLTWRDETVLGRHGEAGGSLLHRLRVDRDGAPVVRSDLAVGPRWPDSLGPAGIGAARAIGTQLVVGAPHREPPDSGSGVRCEALELGCGAVLVTALGDSAAGVSAALDASTAARAHVIGL